MTKMTNYVCALLLSVMPAPKATAESVCDRVIKAHEASPLASAENVTPASFAECPKDGTPVADAIVRELKKAVESKDASRIRAIVALWGKLHSFYLASHSDHESRTLQAPLVAYLQSLGVDTTTFAASGKAAAEAIQKAAVQTLVTNVPAPSASSLTTEMPLLIVAQMTVYMTVLAYSIDKIHTGLANAQMYAVALLTGTVCLLLLWWHKTRALERSVSRDISGSLMRAGQHLETLTKTLSSGLAKLTPPADSAPSRRGSSGADPSAGGEETNNTLTAICNALESLSRSVAAISARVQENAAKDADPPAAATTDASVLPEVPHRPVVSPDGSDGTAQDTVGEHELLAEAWTNYAKSPDFARFREAARRVADQRQLLNDIEDLPRRVRGTEIEARSAQLVEAIRTWDKLVSDLNAAQALATGPARPLATPQRRLNVRNKLQLLLMLTSTDLLSKTLDFRLERWVTEEFIDFADRFLLVRQHGSAQGRPEDLAAAERTVRDLLRVGNLRPVDVVTGETRFDSRCHVGQGQVRRDSMADGVIASVVRNGFEDLTGQVVRQPVVIVNRR